MVRVKDQILVFNGAGVRDIARTLKIGINTSICASAAIFPQYMSSMPRLRSAAAPHPQ
ncbi:hypothetical protein CIT292_08716 [Citrobacter youngae ATCC 29220]|uniref:Insertion element IS1 protein InsA helix-turn-helix domain-containing protein n=1 Tax=Citrobacter youngae ATCC 29220 TaxID=500640 RepID=D4BDZ7_9ENTR|nr:hypothetical protein CIT292_08716 [Citrobacter youngae ATCC 29220]